MSKLRDKLSQKWYQIQGTLFPWISEELGALSVKQQQLVSTLELLRLEDYLPYYSGDVGRPESERSAVARAFVAKSVYNIPTTRMLIERLHSDIQLRRICGWERKQDIPKEWTFSRSLAEFSKTQVLEKIHGAFILEHYQTELVGHLSRDSTAIEAREKPQKKVKKKPVVKRKVGRPKKGEVVVKTPRRIEQQGSMTLNQMLADLPKACDVGTKKNSKGKVSHWIGYKLHIDAADGGIPVSCLLTSASVHDSQAALPMAQLSHQRVTSLYDLMDSAYDVPEIHEHSRKLGHVPLIDKNTRRNRALRQELDAESKRCRIINHPAAETIRYHERSTVERVNARLKDEFGGRFVRVRGPDKVMCHLMFGILALTVDQLLKIIT